MEKMTIHRALSELKTLDARISAATNNGKFIAANRKSNEKIDGLTIEEFKKRCQSDYDSAVSLIKRRKSIKDAIVMSNASTKVKIADLEMSVAEAIERKQSIVYDQNLLNRLNGVYMQANAAVTRENDALPAKLDKYLVDTLGTKDKRDAKEAEELEKAWMKRNEFDLIDQLRLYDKIKGLSDEIMAFLLDVDSSLSESNATTFIEI